MQARSEFLLEFPKVLRLLARYCMSEPGAARVLEVRPMGDPGALAEAVDLTRQFMAWAGESDFSMPGFTSLEGFLDSLDAPVEIFDLDALWAVFQVLGDAREVRTRLAEADAGRWPLLPDLAGPWPGSLWAGLKRCLNPDGLIRDEASPDLYSVRTRIRSLHQRCGKRVKSFVEREGIAPYMQEEYLTVSSDRYVLPLKVSYKNRLPGIIHDYSQTGETCYFEPMFLVDLNNELQELKNEERRAEKEVRRLLSDLLRSEAPALSGVYAFMVDLDVLAAKAAFAQAHGARCVDIGPGKALHLMDVRHPLLPADSAVPVDLALDEGQRALVISGGNAGGKTVCLKTLGLSALMGLSALPVCAAEGSSMPLWQQVFVVLGDEQSIEDSLSTFTAQIRHLSSAYDAVDDSTLVIMDEFGAGTDPGQGAALAQAVVDGFLEKRAWLALATHFPALKAYALTREGVRAASVLFDPATKKPMYRLAYDQVGASQALDVAREHGLPADIIARAEKYMLLDGSDTSQVVDRLNSLAVEREQELAAARAERAKLRDKRARLGERFEREKKEVLDSIRAESREIMDKWRQDKLGRKQAMKELADLRVRAGEGREDADEPVAEAGALAWDDLAEGMALTHTGLGRSGAAVELNERKRQVKLDLGGVAVWADFSDLAPAQGAAAVASAPATRTPGPGPSAMALDLRGRRADEAEVELGRFLDGAVLSGRTDLEIIHGKGTGALRKEVHRVLKESGVVRKFSLAPEDRGGDGMTVVELK
ncbi:endonuclease MutS2 [Desulfocurvus sp. DL9XJH121]